MQLIIQITLIKGAINCKMWLVVMNMYRKYIENLIEWKNSHNRKPLMVWGARQVGKTYLIKEIFAKEYFPNKYIYVDCRTERSFVDYCMELQRMGAIQNFETDDVQISDGIDSDAVMLKKS